MKNNTYKQAAQKHPKSAELISPLFFLLVFYLYDIVQGTFSPFSSCKGYTRKDYKKSCEDCSCEDCKGHEGYKNCLQIFLCTPHLAPNGIQIAKIYLSQNV